MVPDILTSRQSLWSRDSTPAYGAGAGAGVAEGSVLGVAGAMLVTLGLVGEPFSSPRP
ncbi:MAG: hypothetical protein WAW17_09010 [Rhodococcus sp. (in: high G+C Gram-positive bacteria)]|uniref:hypothetical protein n=1 Tax=Rhodococcus sp. TaxID=1831 RepID=UPI003BAF9607